MRRLLELGLLCAVLLAAGPGLAQPLPANAPVPVKAEAVEENTGAEEPAADGLVPEDEPLAEEAAVEEEDTTEEPAEPMRSGYADSTGNLESMDDTDGLRASVRTGTLRAKRGYTPLEVTLHNSESVPRAVRLAFQLGCSK